MTWRERIILGIVAIPLAALVIYFLSRCSSDMRQAGL